MLFWYWISLSIFICFPPCWNIVVRSQRISFQFPSCTFFYPDIYVLHLSFLVIRIASFCTLDMTLLHLFNDERRCPIYRYPIFTCSHKKIFFPKIYIYLDVFYISTSVRLIRTGNLCYWKYDRQQS